MTQKLSSGFNLDRVFAHDITKNEIHQYTQKKSSHSKRVVFSSRADWVRAYAEMCEQSYPLPSLIVDGFPEETAYRQNIHNNINPAKLKNESFEAQDIFEGDRAGDNDEKQVGVHVLVYTNPTLNHTTIVFQGSFSMADAYQDAVWWRDWVVNEQADYSAKQWKSLGNNPKDIKKDSTASDDMFTIALDIVLNQQYPSVISKLHDKTGVSNKDLKKMGYFAVAKKIVDEIMPQVIARGDTLSITGHSLGGTLGSLAHMYLLNTTGKAYDTVAFGGIGLQCLARRIIPDWVNADFQYPNITNYIDNYDLFPMFDSQPGVICRLEPDADERAEALKICSKVIGKGVSLFASSSVGDDWSICRIYTHGIYHYMRFTQNSSLLFEDGTSLLGCGFAPVAKCPSYSVSAGYVLIWFTFAVIMLMIIFMLFVFLPRVIYVKTCGKPKPIIPMAIRKHLCCKRWQKLDVEMK